ncbi:hypothetical protein QBK99_08175 [Corticibacterium sp. UT-5YL-CI-8]|nr:hypothetical protein [Tianweitania sp. UT-5YL-CI-8]
MKKPRYVITKLALDEISAVDLPAQAHAVVSIIKRAEPAMPISSDQQLALVQAWAGETINLEKGKDPMTTPATTTDLVKSYRDKFGVSDAEAFKRVSETEEFHRLYDAEEAEKLAEQHRRIGLSY